MTLVRLPMTSNFLPALIAAFILSGCGGPEFTDNLFNGVGDTGDVTQLPDAAPSAGGAAGDDGSAPMLTGGASANSGGTVSTDAGPETSPDADVATDASASPDVPPPPVDAPPVSCHPGEKSCATGAAVKICDSTGIWVVLPGCADGMQCYVGTCVAICCGPATCAYEGSCSDVPGSGSPGCAAGGCKIGVTCTYGTVTPCNGV